MKKILFRADAAPHIGIGDLVSLINISKYFDKDYEKYFIIKDYKAGVNLIKKQNIKNCSVIDSKISIEDEVKYINNFIVQNNIDILFLEITETKLSNYVGLSKNIKKVAVNFDGYILDDLDLVIDWDVEAYRFFDTLKYPNTKFLLGAKYVILPKEFYSSKVVSRQNRVDYPKILIAMGGADEFDFTSKIVQSIISLDIKVELNIIIGSGYEHKDNLENILNKSNLKYNIKQNIINMLDEYLNSDIGIGAGGLISSEMVASKLPSVLIATYEHQIARCKYFDTQGWAKYLGYRRFDNKKLKEAILNPVRLVTNNIFDTQRIVDEIKKL